MSINNTYEKRITNVFLVALLSIVFFILLIGCDQKQQDVAQPYGEIKYDLLLLLRVQDVPTEEKNSDLPVSPYTFGLSQSALLLDIVDVKESVKFVMDDYSNVKNAVVTTKWIYYTSLLLQEYKKKNISDFLLQYDSFADVVLQDEYCMEKLHMDIYSYIFDEPTSPYCGQSYRDVYKERGEHLPSPEAKTTQSPVFSYMNGEDAQICTLFAASGLRFAALQHYGLVDEKDFEKTVSEIQTSIYRLPSFEGNGEFSEWKRSTVTLNVVGYIETEADKLLSTGVSMDKNSDEYKIVMEQLQNPVFYSLCGNFLE